MVGSMTTKIGAIFDWDGVIVDSARQHEEGWERLAAEVGRTLLADHFKRSFGMKNEVIIPELFGWTRVPDEIRRLSLRKEALYREVVKAAPVAALPGVAAFMEALKRDGILCVIGLRAYFVDWVTAEDVSRGKPDPEVFHRCAERIGVDPARCVVFEDAHVGVEAARRAGMKVVAVTTTHPAEVLGAADRIVRRLDELGVGDLEAMVAS